MIKYLKTFFYPGFITYSYNLSKELVISKILEVFKNKVTLLGTNDMTGNFLNNDTFAINVVSVAYTRNIKYSSRLVGQIIKSKNGMTDIITKAKPSFALYILFFATILFGLVYLYKFLQTGSTEFLLWSLLMLIVGPFLSIGFSNIAIAAIRERYDTYIDKELKL